MTVKVMKKAAIAMIAAAALPLASATPALAVRNVSCPSDLRAAPNVVYFKYLINDSKSGVRTACFTDIGTMHTVGLINVVEFRTGNNIVELEYVDQDGKRHKTTYSRGHHMSSPLRAGSGEYAYYLYHKILMFHVK